MTWKHLACIFIAASCLMAAGQCSAAGKYQKILMVSSQGTAANRSFCRNFSSCLKNVKLNFTNLDSASPEIGGALQKMDGDDLLVIATDDFSNMIAIPDIIRFVSNGGRVFFPVLGGGDESLLNISGVKKLKETVVVFGFKPTVKLFPGLETFDADHMKGRSESHALALDENAELLVTADGDFPLAWKISFGKGKIIVFNSNLLVDSSFCGVVMQLASLLNDYFITTVSNAKLVFIDDFPFPIPMGAEYVITSNYDDMGYDAFYRDIWWPQIKGLAEKHKLKYTCLLLAGNDDSVLTPPEKISGRMKGLIAFYGKELIKAGHELGIHGYNHVPPVFQGCASASKESSCSPWKSPEDMEAGLRCLKQTLDEIFGKMDYFTYAPPMNMITDEGKKAVLNVFPEVKCFAGLRGDVNAKNHGIFYQELGPDPCFPEVYDVPRTSFGELHKGDEMWTIYNYVAYCGIFSHYFHPDDLLDSDRSSNMDWNQMHASFDKLLGNISEKFPFLRGMTAGEFVRERIRTDRIKVYSHKEGNLITVEYLDGDGPLYHYLRINNGLKVNTVENGSCKPIGTSGGLYLLEGVKSPVRITIE